jgi:hypothetical protein
MQELAYFIYRKGYIRTDYGEILKSTDNTPVVGCICWSQFITIVKRQLLGRRQWCTYSLAATHIHPLKYISCIAFLCQQKLIRGALDLNAKKVKKITQILEGKVLL